MKRLITSPKSNFNSAKASKDAIQSARFAYHRFRIKLLTVLSIHCRAKEDAGRGDEQPRAAKRPIEASISFTQVAREEFHGATEGEAC